MFQLHNRDCLQVLAEIQDKSVDLVATDPPYFQVKDDAWDNQWASRDEFLRWLDGCVAQCARVLKPTGSLYLFTGPKLATAVEGVIARHLRVENHIVWSKPSGMHCRQNRASLRRYFPASERIIFATHLELAERRDQDRAMAEACSPLIEYFTRALKRSGLTQGAVNKAMGSQMAGHWFGRSQWRLPTALHYAELQGVLKGHLKRPYSAIRKQYERLLKGKANGAVRPFTVAGSDWYTDVWTCQPVPYYPGKHPCEKPLALMTHIVQASSRPGAVVLDPFMGGGTTGEAALRAGRRFIGCELDRGHFKAARRRLEAL